MAKICFIQHAGEAHFIITLAKQLMVRGIETIFVSKSLDAQREYLEAGFKSVLISEIFNEKGSLSDSELANIDKKYGLPGARSIIDSDVHMDCLFGDDDKAKLQIVGRAYRFWEKFITEEKIDYILSREIATFATRSAYNVGRYLGIPSAQLAIGPGREYFIMSDMGKTSMWTELLDYLSEKRPISRDEEEKVNAFIKDRLPDKQKKMKVSFIDFSFFKGLRRLVGLFAYDSKNEVKRDPVRVASLRYGRKLLQKRILWKYFISIFFKYDEIEEERFVYFPIYSGNETGYLTDDHYWAQNEFSLIVEVSKSLPAGTFLYIKEHPANPGYFSLKEMKRLKKYHNIKVLRPSISSQSLIEKSELVFVLQGTAGWEAFLSKKPVIALGETFFALSDLVYKVGSISELPKIIDLAIKNGSKQYEDNLDDWIWFINGVVSTCGKGELLNPNPPPAFPTDEQNISKIADFVAKKIKKDVNKKG